MGSIVFQAENGFSKNVVYVLSIELYHLTLTLILHCCFCLLSPDQVSKKLMKTFFIFLARKHS